LSTNEDKMKLNIKYTIAWVVWILTFAIIEAVAIFDKKKGDTLSEHIWEWFDIKQTEKFYKLKRFTFVSLLVWFIFHILTGGWV